MVCCINCFNDRFLVSYIKTGAANKADCSYCGSKSVEIMEPGDLADLFQPILDLYIETEEENGSSIVELLKRDWCFLEKLDNDKCIDLLKNIYPETDFIRKKYLPKVNPDSGRIDRWNNFREELKHVNRFFPKQIQQQDIDQLTNLIAYLSLPSNESPKVMYRARCNTEKRAYSKEEMSKPPGNLVGAGRANPIGIPYTYTASDPETAIAEIRPHKSDRVTVAMVNVLEPLNLADLRDPRKTISPFELGEDELSLLYPDIEYLCRLGEELKKPILPHEANLEYLPTQYLCEFIKHVEIKLKDRVFKFDGVIYKSSVGSGVNYAIFNDEKLDIVNVIVYEITDIAITSQMA